MKDKKENSDSLGIICFVNNIQKECYSITSWELKKYYKKKGKKKKEKKKQFKNMF